MRARRSDLVVRAERIVGRNPIRDFLEQNQADAAARAAAAERRYDAYRELAGKAKLRVDELNRLEGEAAELDGKVLSIETRLGSLRRDQQASLERAEVGGADLRVLAPGSLAAFADPLDERAIRGALEQAVCDDLLRARSRTDGPRHAAGFTWDRTARGVFELCLVVTR